MHFGVTDAALKALVVPTDTCAMAFAAPSSAARGFRAPRSIRVLDALALAGLAFFVLHVQLGTGGAAVDDLANRWLYNALILLAVAMCALRTAWLATDRAAWLAITVGVAFWAAGEICYDFVYAGAPPYPSIADVFYLAFYPPLYVGLVLLIRSHVSKFNLSVWLDGVTAALAAAALGAAVLFQVVLGTTSGSASVVITNLAYPLGDVILLALVFAVFALTSWRPGRVWAVIGGALAATALADGIYLFQTATNTYTEGTILDAMWPASILLIGVAAWQPPARLLRIDLEGRPLLATPALCGLIALGVLIADHFHRLNPLALGLAIATLLGVLVRTGLTLRENARILKRSRSEATTDSLTGLGNRRKLLVDLERALTTPSDTEFELILFDLDGFKGYNDSFGHPAGDALLARLGGKLDRVAAPFGSSYRLGGDEFCVLGFGVAEEHAAHAAAAAEALTEVGEGFTVTSSFGMVTLPAEAQDSSEALRVADQRLYQHKNSRRAGRGQPHEVLLQALHEREPGMRSHASTVAAFSVALARRIGIGAEELMELRLAAELHDVGKLAVPDAILHKPGPLDEDEWALLRQHPVVGQRILGAAHVLSAVGIIVRHTHERWDGKGYVDGLAGDAIPFAARVIAVCDSFSAMTSDRPYRPALSPEKAVEELRRCAGSQFDPGIVEAFCRAYSAGELTPAANEPALKIA
jgi:two-component system cell cycle response regulator